MLKESIGALPISVTMVTTCVAVLGGLLDWAYRVERGQKWSITSLILDLLSSAFFGWLAFLACYSATDSIEMGVAASGMAGHMGTRGFWVVVGKVGDRIASKAGK